MGEKKSALIIANFQYEDSVLRQLIAPAQDAEALAKVLGNPDVGGFEVQTLLNEPSHTVSERIEAFYSDRKRDDLLLLYFSGHGVKDEDGQLYFATRNTQHKLLRSTAVWANFVNDVMFRSRSRRQVLLLDCCYSGAFARGMVAKGSKDVGTRDHFEGRGRVVLTASDAMQYSFEGGEVKGEGVRSIFTQSLVRGLETGEADLDGDGLVSLDDLYDYVHDRVTDEMPQQSPGKWAFDVQGEIIIARNPHPPVVKLGDLPSELREAIESPLVGVRVGAVQELERLLRGRNKTLVMAAKEALLSLKEDDSRQVSSAAEKCLATYVKAERPEPVVVRHAPLPEVADAPRTDKAPLPTIDTAEQQRLLEAALPKKIPVGKSTELLTLIRRTDSEGLRAVLVQENIQSLTAEDVSSRPFQLEFPVNQNGELQPAEILLRVDAPDFEPRSQTKKILVPPRGDSATCSFLLAPQKTGNLLVNLEIFKGDLHVASRVITTSAEFSDRELIGVAMTLVSLPLVVVVNQAQAATAGIGSREVLAVSTLPAQPVRPAAPPSIPGPQTTRMTPLPRVDERNPTYTPPPMPAPIKRQPVPVELPGGSRTEPKAPARQTPDFAPLARGGSRGPSLKLWASAAMVVIAVGIGVGYMTFRPSPVRESSAPITTPVASDSKGHSGEGGRPSPGPQSESTKAAEASSAGLQGDAYYEEGAYEKAIREYQRGLSLDPSNEVLQKKINRARRAQAAEQRYGQRPPAFSKKAN